jgi:hypothetical protein
MDYPQAVVAQAGDPGQIGVLVEGRAEPGMVLAAGLHDVLRQGIHLLAKTSQSILPAADCDRLASLAFRGSFRMVVGSLIENDDDCVSEAGLRACEACHEEWQRRSYRGRQREA